MNEEEFEFAGVCKKKLGSMYHPTENNPLN